MVDVYYCPECGYEHIADPSACDYIWRYQSPDDPRWSRWKELEDD